MLSENTRYSHLYNTVRYIPPSVVRQIEEATPSKNETFSKINVNRGNSIESLTGQTAMESLFERTLRGKETYRSMKNKVMYSLSSDVTTHASLNKL